MTQWVPRIPVQKAADWEEAGEYYRALLIAAIEDLDDTSWTMTGRLSMRARALRTAMNVVDPRTAATYDRLAI